MNLLNRLAFGLSLILISLFYSKEEKFFIDSQFSHSSGIYFKPILKARLFSEKYHFISYINVFQPDILKYGIIDFSHKLYEYCMLWNIANDCNLYDHQTQLEFIQRINYFLEEILFISRQARNITNIFKIYQIKSNKEDSYPSTSLFSMFAPFAKIQYFLFDKLFK